MNEFQGKVSSVAESLLAAMKRAPLRLPPPVSGVQMQRVLFESMRFEHDRPTTATVLEHDPWRANEGMTIDMLQTQVVIAGTIVERVQWMPRREPSVATSESEAPNAARKGRSPQMTPSVPVRIQHTPSYLFATRQHIDGQRQFTCKLSCATIVQASDLLMVWKMNAISRSRAAEDFERNPVRMGRARHHSRLTY